ncbi:MAG: hypothetical protein KDE56_00345 [Anaerolineales bacterium]|nr:hypothetical protein [Anaerolineales bacterium]
MSEDMKEAARDPQGTVDETLAFWRELAREMMKQSPTVIEETAKQLIAVTWIL